MPVGGLATPDGDQLEMIAAVIALDGSHIVRGRARAPRRDAAALGQRIGAQLIANGAGEILAQARRTTND